MHLRLTVTWVAIGVAFGVVLCAACDRSDDAQTSSATSATTTTGPQKGGAGAGAAGAGGIGNVGGGGSAGVGAMDPGTCGLGTAPSGPGVADGHVRVVAANLTSGNGQSYDPGHGVRILQGLDADVVLLQEMNFGNNSRAAIDGLVDDICDGECVYVRGPQEQIPNGVLSRAPIKECGSWVDPEVQNRNFVWARIDVPGDADLWAISVHLLSSGAGARADEVTSLLSYIDTHIPASDLIVVGGDLNTDNRSETAVDLLGGLFATSAPHPADHNGNTMTNAPRSRPYDWVIASSMLAPFERPVTLGQSVFASGAVIDTRDYVPLSEIAPALFGDSDAPSMQHMAVIKDFQLDP